MAPQLETEAQETQDLQVSSAEDNAAPAADAAAPLVEDKAPDPDAGLSPFQKAMKAGKEKLAEDEPAPAAAKLPLGQGGALSPAAGGKPEWKPIAKFKAGTQEHEIPDFVKPLLKDEASQKQVVDLLEKAYGLDMAKSTQERHKTRADQFEQRFSSLDGQVEDLKRTYARGDLEGFFSKMAIPEERILQWVLDKVNYSKLPPEQRQALDASRQAQQQAWQTEDHATQAHTQQQQQLAQAVQHGLELALSQSDTKTAAEAYDTRVGKPGAFREEVVNRGHYYWVTQGKLVPPEQAVKEVLALVGTPAAQPNPAAPQAAQVQQAPPVQGTPPPTMPKQTPVIPNVSGRSASPMPKKPQSIDDLKKLYKDMQ